MATNVVMPQMGESIAEGTIVRWIKKVGEAVDRDEPLFEISTDKVDAEVPSPAAGVLTDIKVREGETVPVNSVVAVIGAAGETAVEAAKSDGPVEPAQSAADEPVASAADQHVKSAQSAGDEPAAVDPRRQKSSPLVRRIAEEHHVDISRIRGTGISGRVTKNDILGFLAAGGTAQSAPAAAAGAVRIVPMSVMRRKIAERMVLSARTSPHVYSVYEVNFTRVAALRETHRARYDAAGAKLTYTAFIAKVIVDALGQFPEANASLDGDNIVYRKDINLGIAVALDHGLIVPVIRNADDRNLLGLARAINDIGARARSKKLNPEEVQNGTFTITNPGIFGALYGLPLINQPQVAILGVGAIEKRPVVIDDAIAINPTCHLTLGHDHRLIDGADAGRFLSFVKRRLEDFDESWM